MNGRRVALAALALAMTVFASIAFVGTVMLRALQPQGGEWSMRIGPWQHEVSAPVMLRWATHPLALPLLHDRRLHTRAGTWHLKTPSDGSIGATCEPCMLRLPELGPAPLVLERVVLHARRAGPEAWVGTLELGTGMVSIGWDAKLRRDGLAWNARLEPTPVAALLATLRDGAVPDARHARIEGTFAFDASAVINSHGFTQARVHPRVEGLVVDGLGTEALVTAVPPARCRPTRDDDPPRSLPPKGLARLGSGPAPGRIDGWLPRAVIAAEDQRFFEHGGFDLDEAVHAWIGNRARDAASAARHPAAPKQSQPPREAASEASVGAQHPPRGASTITQQLAKLIYTGDDRSAARKLREWLYAVEMERTLGKGRILQLYLAMAPWGTEVCGGEAASRRYLGKAAGRLAPHEAAWLASLLRQPDAQLARWQSTATIDTDRVARVAEGIRPMPKWRREQSIEELQRWQPAVRGVRPRVD